MTTWLVGRAHAVAGSPRTAGLLAVVGLLALSGAVAVIASAMGPLWAAAAVLALVGGAVIVLWPVTGVLLLLAAIIFKYPEALQALPLGPNRLVGGVLLIILLGALAFRRRLDFARTPTYLAYLVVLAVLVTNIVLLGSAEPPAHLVRTDLTSRSLDRVLTHITFLTFFGAFVRNRRHLLMVVGLFLLALIVTVPGAITHTYDVSAQGVQSLERARAVATTGIQSAENANRLAFVSALGISLIWFGMQHTRRRLLQVAAVPLILALVMTILLSGSRSGLLNLGLLAILLVVQSGIGVGRLAGVAVFGILVMGLGYFVIPEQILTRLLSFIPTNDTSSATQSTGLRALAAALGFRLFAINPFTGVGIGNVRWMTALEPETRGQGLTMHDAYVLALAEGGVILLAAYLLLFFVTWRSLNRSVRAAARQPEVGLGWLVKATRTNLFLLLTFSLFAEAWNEFPFLLILGTSISLAALYMRPQAEPATPAPRWHLSPSST